MIIAQIPVQSLPAASPGVGASPAPIVRDLNARFTCPAVTTFMAAGDTHNPIEVANVQAILKDLEKMDVDTTGVFDEKTDIAVKAFQKKYAAEVLAPWGATRASGIINITTAKKLNSIACGAPMALSAEELAVMDRYKARPDSGVAMSGGYAVAPVAPRAPAVTSSPANPAAVSLETASAADASSTRALSDRFWSYLKRLFGGR